MRIVVLGATGMVGTRVVDEAVTRGHQVVAASRRATDGRVSAAVSSVGVDVLDRTRVRDLLENAAVAVGAVRPQQGQETGAASSTTALLDAAAAAGVPVVLVGGAGPLSSPGRPGTLVVDDERFVPPEWRNIAAASVSQLRTCEAHPSAWVYLSPPALLEPGRRTGRYRRGGTELLVDDQGRSRISVEDLAVAVLDEIEHAGGDRHFTVAY
jgi:putative NADH-flavin reductase